MDKKAEIKRMEEAIDIIHEFIREHIEEMDPKALNKWDGARKGFVEELYYMRKSCEDE